MRKIWLPEEDAIMRDKYPCTLTSALAKELNRSERSVYSRANTLGLVKSEAYREELQSYFNATITEAGKKTRFVKGQIPPNKGKKIEEYMSPEAIEKVRKTTFKKGNIPANHKPIGHQRITKDGYIMVKVEEPNRFVLLHRFIWKVWNGPIPKGSNIIFKDGNKQNCNIENLDCITNKKNMQRNTIQRYPEELKEMIRLTGKLNRKINQKTK